MRREPPSEDEENTPVTLLTHILLPAEHPEPTVDLVDMDSMRIWEESKKETGEP